MNDTSKTALDIAVENFKYDPNKKLNPLEVGMLFRKFQLAFGFTVPSSLIAEHGDKAYEMVNDAIELELVDASWEEQSKQELSSGNCI